jgi:chlorinating enzyme
MKPFDSWSGGEPPSGWFSLPMSQESVDFYDENGFIVIEDCFSAAEVDSYLSEASAICQGRYGPIPGSVPVPGESEHEALARHLCIHMPNKVSTAMQQQSVHPNIADVLTKLIGPNVKCMQSMLFIKASGKPGQAWHQDEAYIPTRDRSLTGCWLALDDATVENGCLWVIPGSHKRGVLWPMKFHADERFDCAHESYRTPYQDEDAVPVEVKTGSLVIFNGYLLHRSLPNRSPEAFRRSLVTHYMSAESLLPWMPPQPGQSMALRDVRDVWMLAGEDPYAWKGTEEIHSVHLRSDGKAGCENWT